MSKAEVLQQYKIIFDDPGSLDGEYFFDNMIKRTQTLILNDRESVVEVFREWLYLRKEPYHSLVIRLTREYLIKELKEDIKTIRNEIILRKLFLPTYLEPIDKALKAIK